MTTPADYSNARFSDYLRSLSDASWWNADAFMYEIDESTWFEFALDSKTEEKPKQAGEKPTEKTLSVLQAIQDYAHEKILIVGSPGAGKSTLLARLLWQAAQKAQSDAQAPIPVLVKLKSYTTIGDRPGIRGLILSSLESHDPDLDAADLKHLLAHKRLLLLADGLNELTHKPAKTELEDLCRHQAVIATSRNANDWWSINRKLEIQPLASKQVMQFLEARLPNSDRAEVKKLGDRVKDFGQTPLIVWMMYSIFRSNRKTPITRGDAYREFTGIYAERAKKDIDLNESRGLLSKLAFELMHADKPTDFRPDMSEVDAQNLLGSRALELLVKNHLLQAQGNPGNCRISFCHQSLQEYYAAEALLVMLCDKHPDVIDGQRLQYFYLNYLKWTEPLAMMLGLLENKTQALRVVQLALGVDYMLGARLAGEVRSDFQQESVGMVNALDVPEWLKIRLLGRTRSDCAIPNLFNFATDSDSFARINAAIALGEIASDGVIIGLLSLAEDPEPYVRMNTANVLGEIDSEAGITGLLTLMEDAASFVRRSAAAALGKIGSDKAITGLLKLVEHSDSFVRRSAADALSKINSDAAISGLLKLVENSDFGVCRSAASALSNIRSETALAALLKLIENSDFFLRWKAADALGNIGSDTAIAGLLKLREDSNFYVRESAQAALIKIGSNAVISILLKLMENNKNDVYWYALSILVEIGSETVVLTLLKLVKDANFDVRRYAIYALGKLASEDAVPSLLKLVEDSDSDLREGVADALGRIGSDAAIPGLLKLVEDGDFLVRQSAAISLGKIGSETAVLILLKLINDSVFYVRMNVADALGKVGSDTGIPGLLKLVEDSDVNVLKNAADALGKIGSDAAVPSLLKLMEYPNSHVRVIAIEALGKIGSETTIPNLLEFMEDSDVNVRWRAAKALENFKNDRAAHILPNLLTLIPTESGEAAFLALTAIQDNCQFYDYAIAQLKLEPYSPQRSTNNLLAKIDETTQDIDQRTQRMENQPTFHINTVGNLNTGNVTIQGDQIGIQHNYAPEPKETEASEQLTILLKKLRTSNPNATDEQIFDILLRGFQTMPQQNPQNWKSWQNILSLLFAGGTESIKVWQPLAGIPIEIAKRLYEIYQHNQKQLPSR